MKYKLDKEKIHSIVKLALEEDIGEGDITTENIIPPTLKIKARIIAEEKCIICGLPVAKEVFKMLDRRISWRAKVSDGDVVKPKKVVVEIFGSARAILAGERVALNFLQHLSGIATYTNKFVKLANGKFDIYDTRKTHPGLRYLEKYAVLCGGGKNHRLQLDDMVLVKDNHIKICELYNLPIEEILYRMRQRLDYTTDVEIECCNLREVKLALKIKPDIIMLDNMSFAQLKKAIKMIRKNLPKTKIEISGKLDEQKVKKLRRLNIDFASLGRITHSARDISFSLEVV
jgi:nicotinate-nucleotide pyrophosphorylase (carboxylating)